MSDATATGAIYAYLRGRRQIDPSVEAAFLAGYRKAQRIYRRLWPVARLLEHALPRPAPESALFVGTRFMSLLLGCHARAHTGVLLRKSENAWSTLRHRVPLLLHGYRWQDMVFRDYPVGDGSAVESTAEAERPNAERAIEEMERLLRRLRPRCLILANDSLLLERALITAARCAGVPTYALQDGLYMLSSDPRILHGGFADHALVWGEATQRLLIEKGVTPADRVQIFGYPFAVERAPVVDAAGARTLCFLGQPWESYDATLQSAKAELIEVSRAACAALDWRFVYRPHPMENRGDLGVEDALVSPAGQTLREAIASYGTFVSMNSTALLEATLAGRRALQLLDSRFRVDDFAEVGICPSVRPEVDQLAATLADQSVRESRSSGIVIPDDPVAALLSIVDS